MSVKLDLTVVAPELLDAVVFMDNSPAYDAFRTETEAILADFNKNEHFGAGLPIDEKALTEACGDTLRNIHEAFFVWLCRDEIRKGRNIDAGYSTYLKLFFKSNCDRIAALNGGNAYVAAEDIVPLKERFISEIGSDPALYKSIKDFFAGYIYGYYFNFLTEQQSMLKYAEFLVCMGIMTGKLTSSVAAQQKVLLRMANLLTHDRIKYAAGFVPVDVVSEIILSRLAFPNYTDEENAKSVKFVKDYLNSHYETQTDSEGNELISASALCDAASGITGSYISVKARSADIYDTCFAGDMLNIDGTAEPDDGYTPDGIAAAICGKLSAELVEYFDSGREPELDVSLESGTIGYKYPLIYRDGDDLWYSEAYRAAFDETSEDLFFAPADVSELPLKDFAFAAELLASNPVRDMTNGIGTGFSVRKDKLPLLGDIAQISGNMMLSETNRRMFVLEKLMHIISGSCTADKYNAAVEKYVYGTKLYEEYIRFRMTRLLDKGMESLDDKKQLLAEINRL